MLFRTIIDNILAECLRCDECLSSHKKVIYINFDEDGIKGGELPWNFVLKIIIRRLPVVIWKRIKRVFESRHKYPF